MHLLQCTFLLCNHLEFPVRLQGENRLLLTASACRSPYLIHHLHYTQVRACTTKTPGPMEQHRRASAGLRVGPKGLHCFPGTVPCSQGRTVAPQKEGTWFASFFEILHSTTVNALKTSFLLQALQLVHTCHFYLSVDIRNPLLLYKAPSLYCQIYSLHVIYRGYCLPISKSNCSCIYLKKENEFHLYCIHNAKTKSIYGFQIIEVCSYFCFRYNCDENNHQKIVTYFITSSRALKAHPSSC